MEMADYVVQKYMMFGKIDHIYDTMISIKFFNLGTGSNHDKGWLYIYNGLNENMVVAGEEDGDGDEDEVGEFEEHGLDGQYCRLLVL